MDRRQVLKGAAGGLLTLWTPSLLRAAQISDKLAVLDAGGSNVVAFNAGDGLILVDTGGPKSGDSLLAALKNFAGGVKVQTAFNTHYHLDQTGNNEIFAAAGAKIIAHDRTRQWMSVDTWLPDLDRYEKARPKGAWPTQTFQTTGTLKTATGQIEYGYLIMAHTSGDIYVYFKDANVLAVGD